MSTRINRENGLSVVGLTVDFVAVLQLNCLENSKTKHSAGILASSSGSLAFHTICIPNKTPVHTE